MWGCARIKLIPFPTVFSIRHQDTAIRSRRSIAIARARRLSPSKWEDGRLRRLSVPGFALTDDIRLLRMDTIDASGAMVISLIHVDRHQLPAVLNFLALFYRWEHEHDLARIKLRHTQYQQAAGMTDGYEAKTLLKSSLSMIQD